MDFIHVGNIDEAGGKFGALGREINSLDGFRSPAEGWGAVKRIFARRGLKVVPHDDGTGSGWGDYESFMRGAKDNSSLPIELATRGGELVPFDLMLSWADTGRPTAERVVFTAEIDKRR